MSLRSTIAFSASVFSRLSRNMRMMSLMLNESAPFFITRFNAERARAREIKKHEK